jgi:hypothetical protein
MQAILQKDDSDILLIQEPWFQTVTTLRSDTNPEGDSQMGAPANNQWDCHVPTLPPNSTCKALTYSRHSLNSIVKHATSHPAANPNTVVLDIDDGVSTAIRVINVYHEVLQRGHALHHLMAHEIDD